MSVKQKLAAMKERAATVRKTGGLPIEWAGVKLRVIPPPTGKSLDWADMEGGRQSVLELYRFCVVDEDGDLIFSGATDDEILEFPADLTNAITTAVTRMTTDAEGNSPSETDATKSTS